MNKELLNKTNYSNNKVVSDISLVAKYGDNNNSQKNFTFGLNINLNYKKPLFNLKEEDKISIFRVLASTNYNLRFVINWEHYYNYDDQFFSPWTKLHQFKEKDGNIIDDVEGAVDIKETIKAISQNDTFHFLCIYSQIL